MGYFKNIEIALQTEEADRPRPATSHVAFPSRRLERAIVKATARRTRCRVLKIVGAILTGVLVLLAGVMLGGVL